MDGLLTVSGLRPLFSWPWPGKRWVVGLTKILGYSEKNHAKFDGESMYINVNQHVHSFYSL